MLTAHCGFQNRTVESYKVHPQKAVLASTTQYIHILVFALNERRPNWVPSLTALEYWAISNNNKYVKLYQRFSVHLHNFFLQSSKALYSNWE